MTATQAIGEPPGVRSGHEGAYHSRHDQVADPRQGVGSQSKMMLEQVMAASAFISSEMSRVTTS